MSQLSEEQIRKLWIETSCIVPTCDHYKYFARAIEREAYKQGQEAMRERVFQISDCEAIRNLEIEEQK